MTGRGKKLNFPILKSIKITKEQSKNWNAKNIRKFLDNNGMAIKEESNNYGENMKNRVLHDKIDKLEKLKIGYKQFNKLFEDITKNAKKIIKNNELGFFKQLIKENIDINLIKQINSEMI